MKILGIDPGFGITGYGVIEVETSSLKNIRLIEAGVLRSKLGSPLSERLQEIYSSLIEIITEYHPEAMAVEDIFSVGTFPGSAIRIGNAQGVILLAAAQTKVPVHTYYPIQIKKALLGHGRAAKSQMQKMVQRTLNLKTVPQPDDVADAIAVALCHANRIRI